MNQFREDFPVVKMMPDSVDFLIVFVSLARNEKKIARSGQGGCCFDGMFPVCDFEKLFSFGQAGGGFLNDGFRFFRARIVAGDDGEIGESAADFRHARALGAVAVSAASE